MWILLRWTPHDPDRRKVPNQEVRVPLVKGFGLEATNNWSGAILANQLSVPGVGQGMKEVKEKSKSHIHSHQRTKKDPFLRWAAQQQLSQTPGGSVAVSRCMDPPPPAGPKVTTTMISRTLGTMRGTELKWDCQKRGGGGSADVGKILPPQACWGLPKFNSVGVIGWWMAVSPPWCQLWAVSAFFSIKNKRRKIFHIWLRQPHACGSLCSFSTQETWICLYIKHLNLWFYSSEMQIFGTASYYLWGKQTVYNEKSLQKTH